MSMPMDCPPPGISALRAEDLILIFSRMGEAEAATGSTSFVETVSLFPRTFRRWALAFSLATDILIKGNPIRNKGNTSSKAGVNAPVLPEYAFPPLLDLRDAFHSLDRGLDQVAVVAYWDISALFKVDGGVLS